MSASSSDNSIESDIEKLKIGTEPKSLEFSDLNDDAIGLIIDKLELKERLVLRKVSSGCRKLVDQKKSILKTLNVACEYDHILVCYNDYAVFYAHPNCASSHLYIAAPSGFQERKVIKAESFMKMALDDLQLVFKDKKVKLDILDVRYYISTFGWQSIHYDIEKYSGELTTILRSLDQKVSVQQLEIDAHSSYNTLAILPYLKPGTLEVIDVGYITNEESEVSKIAELEQWKQAKELRIEYYWNVSLEKYFMHFKRFFVYNSTMNLHHVLKCRDFFSKSPNFEYGEICTHGTFFPENIEDHLGEIISREGNYVYIFHHPMATNSNQVLEMKVNLGPGPTISISKIARPSS